METFYELKRHRSAIVASSLGATITNLELSGTPILGTYVRGDRKKAATHPCTPNFGPETTTSYGLPQHGPMRNNVVVIEEKDDTLVTRYAIDCGTYPQGLSVVQTFAVQEASFILETTHINSVGEPLPLNFGEHCYWDTPHGWEGLTVNNTDITSVVKSNGVIELRETNEIQIPGKPRIILRQTGLPLAMCWAYGSEKEGFDAHYVCIEPIQGNPKLNYFGSEASLLAPNSSTTQLLTIEYTFLA